MTKATVQAYEDLGTVLSGTINAITSANVVTRLRDQFNQEIKKYPKGKYLELICQFQKTRDGTLINGNFSLRPYDSKSTAEEKAKYDSTHALLPDKGWSQVACVLGPDSYPNPFSGGFFTWFCVYYK